MSDEQFQAMLDIHTIVPFRVARALAPALARGGQVGGCARAARSSAS